MMNTTLSGLDFVRMTLLMSQVVAIVLLMGQVGYLWFTYREHIHSWKDMADCIRAHSLYSSIMLAIDVAVYTGYGVCALCVVRLIAICLTS